MTSNKSPAPDRAKDPQDQQDLDEDDLPTGSSAGILEPTTAADRALEAQAALAAAFEPARLLHQGNGIIALDKPAGIPVHQGTDHPIGLAEALDQALRERPHLFRVRPDRVVAPLHRIDREASGVTLFGLEEGAAAAVQAAFAGGLMSKRYIALVAGPVRDRGRIKGKVRTKLRGVYKWLPAQLEYRRLTGDERLSLVEVIPHEGRTHQIRSLFAGADRPLAGDLRFGKPKPARQFLEKFGIPGLLLHARELVVPEGVLGPRLTLRAPVPETFLRVLREKGWIFPEDGNF